ncbi:hypothetical protein KKC17_01560 [Patescibacteria group bacterium]|nr:hypothetical protein [Patescibacteria group bacterium]
MKSNTDLVDLSLINDLIHYKNELEKLNKALYFQNILFKEFNLNGDLPTQQQIVSRKKTKAEYNEIQDVYKSICLKIPNYKGILKEIRLAEAGILNKNKIRLNFSNTLADPPNLILGLSQ